MKKEQVCNVKFDKIPDIRIRVISEKDTKEIIKNKKKIPFQLHNIVKVKIKTTKREISFTIFKGYTWNGADIPRIFWRIIGARCDNDFLIASLVHDYMLEFQEFLIKEILSNTVTKKEYRRLTSLIFRHIIKQQGTGVVKANIMSWFVDLYQMLKIRNKVCH